MNAIDESDSEWVKLYNPTGGSVDIGKWTIDTGSIDRITLSDAKIPTGTIIPSYGF